MTSKTERPTAPRIAERAEIAGAVIAPAVVVIALTLALFDASPTSFVPHHNDEVSYWLSMRAHAAHGLDCGYFGNDELAAPAQFTPHSTKGPVFSVLYGSVPSLIGWISWWPLALNAIVTAAALLPLAVAATSRAARWRAILLPALFGPLLTLLPTSMMDSLQYAVAILLSGPCADWVRGRGMSARRRVATAAVIAVASLMRPLWAVMWLPYFYGFNASGRVRLRAILALLGTGLATFTTVLIFREICAPSHRPFVFIRALTLEASPRELLDHVRRNVERLLAGDTAAVWLVRAQVAAVLVLAIAALPRVLRQSPGAASGVEGRFAAFTLCALGAPVAATVVIYLVGLGADYRVLSAHLLLACCVGLRTWGGTRSWVVWIVIGSNVLGFPAIVSHFDAQRRPNFTYPSERIERFAADVAPHLTFREGHDRWCNTLLIQLPYPYLYPEFMGLPPGFGVHRLYDARRIAWPANSGYVMVDESPECLEAMNAELHSEPDGTFTLWKRGTPRLRMRKLASTALGSLYRNLDARCAGDGHSD